MAVRVVRCFRGWTAGLAVLASILTGASHAQLPRVPTAQLPIGSWRLVPDPYSSPPRESVLLLVRLRSGQLKVWFLPVRDGEPRLPLDEHWNPGLSCRAIHIDFDADEIGCRDPGLAPEIAARFRWRLDGARRTDFVPALLAVPGRERDGHFVLHQP